MENDKIEIKKSSFLDKVSGGLMKVGAFMGQQRHFSAIRDAFGAFLPLLIVGAIAVMVNSVFIQSSGLLATLCGADEGTVLYENWSTVAAYISPLFDGINNATMNLFALYIAFLLGYFLMGSYGGNQLMGGLIGLASFMLLDVVGATGDMTYLGAKGIVFAFVTGLTAPMLLFKLQNIRAMQINMPEGVPPVVGNSLNSLFPFIITILVFGAIQPIWGAIMMGSGVDIVSIAGTDYNIYYIANALYAILVVPFMNLAQSPFAVFLILFLVGLFWFFGVHGNNVMGPVVNALWTPAIVYNVAFYGAYGSACLTHGFVAPEGTIYAGESLYIWTEQTMNCFALMGGASSVLGLLFAINIFSKLPAQKAVSSIATPIACFNISEPTMFGLPVVLNPAYFVPFIFAGSLQGMIAYFLTAVGIVNPTVVLVPWTTPIFLSGILATLDWTSLILTAINLVLVFFLYLPFVLFDVKSQTKIAAEAAGVPYEEFKISSEREMLVEKAERKSMKGSAKITYKIEILEGDINYINNKISILDSKIGMKKFAIDQSKANAEHNVEAYKQLGKPDLSAKEAAKIIAADKKILDYTSKIENKKEAHSVKISKIQKEIDSLNSELPNIQAEANRKFEKAKADIEAREAKKSELAKQKTSKK